MDESVNGSPDLNPDQQQSFDQNRQNGRRKVTKEDFYLFCKIVLEHSNYDEMIKNEKDRESQNSPQLADEAIGTTNGDSTIENSSFEESSDLNGTYDTNDQNSTENNSTLEGDESTIDGYNSITCFCNKPFEGRPMIECSACLTWYHMACVKVKRSNIPKFYYCYKCRESGVSSASLNDEEIGSGLKGSTKGSTKSNVKVKQKKMKKSMLSKMKQNSASLFRPSNSNSANDAGGFLNSYKKSKIKKLKKMSLSPTKYVQANTNSEIGMTSTPRPTNSSPIAAITANTSINQRVLEIGESMAELKATNGYYNESGATHAYANMESSSSTTSILQKSLVRNNNNNNNNNNHIKYNEFGPEPGKTSYINNFNGTSNETTNELFNKRIKLS